MSLPFGRFYASSLVSAQDYDGRTPLHVAAFYNCLQAAAFLLTHGAPVNAQDRWGNSVSHSQPSFSFASPPLLLRSNNNYKYVLHPVYYYLLRKKIGSGLPKDPC